MLQRRSIKSQPISWAKEEEDILLRLINEKKDIVEICANFPHRTKPSIRSKMRKIKIINDIFGSTYRKQKISFTSKIASDLRPEIVFDAYAGSGHQTFEWIRSADVVFASEKNPKKFMMLCQNIILNNFIEVKPIINGWRSFSNGNKRIHIFSGDAVKAAAYISINVPKVDLIDLDTCGSTILTLPTYLNLLKPKYLVITHGEFHSYRFKREDVLRRVFCHRDVDRNPFPVNDFKAELDKAVKAICLRAHNETKDSFYPVLIDELWLGDRNKGMLRRLYKLIRPDATSDVLNEISMDS